MKLFVGVDIGTYSSKGVLTDSEGRILAHCERPHDVEMPRHGWAEHDAEGVWWQDFCAVARDLTSQAATGPTEIAGVGVSAIAPCVVPVDAAGKPLRKAILYGIDTRAAEETDQLTRALKKEWIQKVSGSYLSSQSAGPKILWLKHHERETWRAADKFLTSTGYIVRRLTGRAVIDNYTAAFYGPLFDIHARQWQPRAVEAICEASQLPEPGWTTEIAGTVTAEAAEATGIAGGTPVIFGTADAAAEALGAGVAAPGDAMLMYGSSLFIIALGTRLAPGGVFWPAPFLFPRSFALAAGMATSGAITEWFRRNLTGHSSESADESSSHFARLAAEAASVAPGSEGLVMLPYFSGERTPINDPQARGIIAGLTLRHSRAHLYRAILEGVAYGIRHNLEEMSKRGTSPTRLFSVGGGTKNREWLQIVSDVTKKTQIVCETAGACMGDALLAGIGCGEVVRTSPGGAWRPPSIVVTPNPRHAEIYDHCYELYRDLYRGSVNTVHGLAELAEGRFP